MLQLKQTLAAAAAFTVLSGAAYAQDNEPVFTPDEQTTLNDAKTIFNCVAIADQQAIEFGDEILDECADKYGVDIDALEEGLDDMVNQYGWGPVFRALEL